MLSKIVCCKVNGNIIWSASGGFITIEKHKSGTDRILATSKYKGVKILEVFHEGKIIYLYKRGNRPINISSNFQNVKNKIREFIINDEKNISKTLKKGFCTLQVKQ